MKRRANYAINPNANSPLPPTTSFAGPIAANETAASGIAGLTDGQEVYILSHRSIWVSDPNSTLALVANQIINRSGGGRLIRTTYADPKWASSITDVYLDLNNTTGIASNENQGIFTSAKAGNARLPLLTWSEIYKRFYNQTVITGDLVNFVFTIHVISGISNLSDPCTFQFVCGEDTSPRIVGEAPTTLLGPVALTASTAQNPAVPAPGGAPASIQVGAQNWAAFLTKRMRRVSDGSVAYILKDLGAGSARISQPQLTNESTFDETPTNVTWNAGDSVVVEDLTTFAFGRWDVQFPQATTFGFIDVFNLLNVNMLGQGGVLNGPDWRPNFGPGGTMVAYQCTFDRLIDSSAPETDYNGCCARQGFYWNGFSFGQAFGSGTWTGGAIFNGAQLGSSEGPAAGCIGYFAYVQGGPGVQCRNFCDLGSFSVWDSITNPTQNPGGHAILIGTQTPDTHTLGACRATNASANTIFGTGAAGVGIRVGANSDLTYATLPNITGAGGDFQLGNSSSGFWWDATTTAYKPAAGAGVTFTWAHLAAAKGAAGFGDAAHEPDKNAHICKVTTT